MALQTIVSRNVDPLQMAVVTVGALHAGKANNVIPQTATLEISVRALDREVRARSRATPEGAGHRAGRELRRARRRSTGGPGYAVLVNTPEETAFAREVAHRTGRRGARRRYRGRPLSGSEDFAFMLEKVPGSYLLIGNGAGEGDGHGACMVHNPGYDFNDANVAIGSAYWVLLAERFLAA